MDVASSAVREWTKQTTFQIPPVSQSTSGNLTKDEPNENIIEDRNEKRRCMQLRHAHSFNIVLLKLLLLYRWYGLCGPLFGIKFGSVEFPYKAEIVPSYDKETQRHFFHVCVRAVYALVGIVENQVLHLIVSQKRSNNRSSICSHDEQCLWIHITR